jgi:hypothetical protein
MTDEETAQNCADAITDELKNALTKFLGKKNQKKSGRESVRRSLVFNYKNNGIVCGKSGTVREK